MSLKTKPQLTDDQIKVIVAILDTVVPELSGQELEDFIKANSNGTNEEELRAFGKAGIVNQNVADAVLAKLNMLPAEKLEELSTVFKVLSTKLGTLALGGTFTDFPSLPRSERTRIFLGWANSRITKLRIFARAMISLAAITFYSQPLDVVFKAIEYPGPDPEMHSERFTTADFPEYDFVEAPAQGLEMTVDVVIVGSGAGGGVMAAELSKAGNKVLVIEKGHYYHQREFTLEQADSFAKFYENGATVSSADGALTVLAGSTFGGGTTVNWCASLQLPHYVREEWAKKGLRHFVTPAYQESIDAISKRLNITDKYIEHNKPNALLIEGCRKLGFPYKNIPQNTGGAKHSCGWCCFGCRFGEKQGTMMTFLRDAKDHGALFMQDTHVDRVLIAKGKAVGVQATQNGRRVVVKANKVVVSAGSLHTPVVLKRSGLKNKFIGQNLYLHPVNYVFGRFKERIDCYQGSIMTALSTVVEDLDGHGFGAKIEIPSHHPSLNAAFAPWRSGADHKARMLEMNHIMPVLVLSRDRDGGSIVMGEDGQPRIHYEVSKHDVDSIVEGMLRSLQILVAAGATHIWTTQRGLGEFEVNAELGVADPAFEKYLAAVRQHSVKAGSNMIGAAHQMGTCRMGASPSTGAVKPTGESWEVKNLYVADASTFPSASGVNPMLTTYSIAYSIAQGIKKADLGAKL